MEPEKRRLLKWELRGFGFALIVGTLSHFCFELTGFFRGLAWFFPVNESPWEHLKLTYFPLLLWSIVQFQASRTREFLRDGHENGVNNYWFARLAGCFAAMMMTVISWSTQHSIMGHSFLPLDISVMYLGLFASALICWKIEMRPPIWTRGALQGTSLAGFGLLAASFAAFTFFTPATRLWMDRKCQAFGPIEGHVLFSRGAALNCPVPGANATIPGLIGFVPLAIVLLYLSAVLIAFWRHSFVARRNL